VSLSDPLRLLLGEYVFAPTDVVYLTREDGCDADVLVCLAYLALMLGNIDTPVELDVADVADVCVEYIC